MLPLLVFAIGTTLAPAAEPVRPAATLKVGDPAPALTVGKWVQGEPVAAFDRDHAYLIECWATWCGPCKAAIPHVNELHEKFKDQGLVVIGQNVWETDVAKVEPFVKAMAGKLNYRVALDDTSDGGKGRVANAWLQAAGLKGIPATFLIDKNGVIAWIGHPMQLKETDVADLLAGKFFIKKPATDAQPATPRSALTDSEKAAFAAIRARDWPKAEAAIEKVANESPPGDHAKSDALRLDLLIAKNDQDAAAALAEKIAKESGNDLFKRHSVASRLARIDAPTPIVLDAAERIATGCNEALNGKDAASLITLARIAFLRGDQAKAVEQQTKVVELSKPTAQPRMKQFLESYQAGKLPESTRLRPIPAAR
jgi:thiol-disulfide isomerase/thioredoxin